MSIEGVKPGQERKNPFRENVVWDIIPRRTALIVVDMQNVFVDEKGTLYVPATKDIIPRINEIANTCREHGILIAWLRISACSDGADIGYIRDFLPAIVAGYREGTWGAEFYPDLDVKDTDLIVTKKRYSAFIPGSSNLDRLLRYRDIDTVIIAGVATTICCGTTAMDAMMMDYKVIFVSDANASLGETEPGGCGAGIMHEVQLLTLRSLFATVCTTDELITEVKKFAKK